MSTLHRSNSEDDRAESPPSMASIFEGCPAKEFKDIIWQNYKIESDVIWNQAKFQAHNHFMDWTDKMREDVLSQ